MLFLSPLALFGLAAALVPPLLHLFQRRRPPEFEFPAVRYLAQTEREAERTLKLRNLLLMLLRVAAIVLLVLAAARPVVPRSGVAAVHEPLAVALVLDNSLSSGAVVGGRRVLDDLAQRARETLRAAQAGDALWVIGADLVARRGTPAELLDLVSRMQPLARRLDLVEATGLAARLVEGSGYARGEVHVLSDLQASALVDERREPGKGEGDEVKGDGAARDLTVLVYHPAAAPPANRGVVDAKAVPPIWLAGAGAVVARVGGSGGARGGPVPVALQLGGRAGGRALADTGAVTLAAPALAPGWRTGEVALEADELRADDRRPVAVRVVPPAVVRADAAADPGPFVRQALAALVAGQQARDGDGGVVVGGPAGRRPAIVFPPAEPSQLGALNRALAAAGAKWQLGERIEREDTLAAPLVPELAGARVKVRWRLVTPGTAADSGQVLARAGGAGGEPWLVRDGAVVVVGSRMDPAQTNLPLAGGFVPFMSALANRIVRGEAGVLNAVPGATVMMPAGATTLQLGPDSTRPVSGGARVLAPELPGVYPVRSGADTVAMLVVASDAAESDLTRAGPALVRARLPGRVTLTGAPAAYAAARFHGAGRSELTGALLLAALLLLVAEGLVAAGRRGAAVET